MKFILILFLQIHLNVSQYSLLTGSYTCNKDIVESYGLQSYGSSSKEEISMCPSITYSCCNPKTQLQIYKQWIFAAEEVKIRNSLNFLEEVYSQILSIAEKYGQIAQKYEDDFGEAQLTDCHVITKKMLEFQVDKIINPLRQELKKVINFMNQSISGFYCSICDAKTHEYYDMHYKTIQYSQKFCRNMISSVLKFKLYFETNLIPFLNLGTRVLYTCNTMGQFVIDGVPQNVQLHSDVQESRKLEQCFKVRNQSYYLKYCKFMCEEFKPTIINEKLFPHLLKYSYFIINIHKRLNFLEQEEIGVMKKEGDKIDLKKEESFWSLPPFYQSMVQVNQKLKDVKIYMNLGKVDLADFKGFVNQKVKEEEGIDFSFIGINSQMTETVYKQKVFEYELSKMGLKNSLKIQKIFEFLIIVYIFNQ